MGTEAEIYQLLIGAAMVVGTVGGGIWFSGKMLSKYHSNYYDESGSE